MQPALRRVVPIAVDRAIREIIQPVVERSVTIACITSREMILKDFAMEPDEMKLRNATHLMVSNLAGALALVTCKEPLRVSIINHLRSLVQSNLKVDEPNVQTMVEQFVHACSSDNLELGCMLVEKAATEKAIRDIEEKIEGALTARRTSAKQGRQFFDMSIFNSGRFPGALPDILLPSRNPGGLKPHQLAVYYSFQRAPRPPIMRPSQGGVDQVSMPLGPILQEGQDQNFESSDVAGSRKANPSILISSQALEKCQFCFNRIDRCIANLPNDGQSNNATGLSILPRDHEICLLLREIQSIRSASPQPDAFYQQQSNDSLPLRIMQIGFTRLFENPTGNKLHTEVYLAVLAIFVDRLGNSRDSNRETPNLGKRSITQWLISVPFHNRLMPNVAVGLIKSKLLVMQDFDVHLSKLVQAGAVKVAITIVQQCLLDNRYVPITDLLSTLDALQNVAGLNRQQNIANGGAGGSEESSGLSQMLDNVCILAARAQPAVFPTAVSSGQQQSMMAQNYQKQQQNNFSPGLFLRSNDPLGIRQQTAQLLHRWIQICNRNNGAANETVHKPYLGLLQHQGVLKGDENANQFFRITVELCIESYISQSNASSPQWGGTKNGNRAVSKYVAIDAFKSLVVLLVKYADVRARAGLISMLLEVIAAVMYRECVMRKQYGAETDFDQRPYFRLLLVLQQDLIDLYDTDGAPEEHMLSLLTSFADVYKRLLSPKIMPGFAFSWLELVSCPTYMPRLLKSGKQGKGLLILEMLLVELFEFMYPFLQEGVLSHSVRVMYKGILRVMLVLLHDFPAFLCVFHSSLCDAIAPSCVQLRNLILSAFPRATQLPDPFTPNLNVDRLPEAQTAPSILSQFSQALTSNNLKNDVDAYLKTGQTPNFLSTLPERLVNDPGNNSSDGGNREYNVPLINSLVLYVGVHAIGQLSQLAPLQKNKGLTLMNILSQPQTAISLFPLHLLTHLVTEMEPEGRYYVLNAMANQLRFPSTHTHLFSCLLLYLFQGARSDFVREQITRVLLERLIVHRPHPWGLLITFIELIKNKSYSFWDYSFTRCTPEIHRLFESVARKCMGGSATAGNNTQTPQTVPVSRAD